MENVTIISHLTPREWKMSWENKVVEDTRENMRAYQQQNCFWGHFKNDRDFTICHHKEFEIKGMSFGLYFNGTIEDDERGCKIVGENGKSVSWNGSSALYRSNIWSNRTSGYGSIHCRDCIACHFTDCLFCKATEGAETDSGSAGENIL